MACGGLFSILGMLWGIDVILFLVVAAGSKSGGGGTETCEGSEGDLITEALTDATAGNSTSSNKGWSEVKSSLPTVIAAGDNVGGGGVLSMRIHSSDSSGISSSHISSTW